MRVVLREVPEIDPAWFRDNHHLYAEGAAAFSTQLGARIKEIREQDIGAGRACNEN